MRIALRHIGARMTQQLLYLVQAHAVLDQKAGVGMAKIMDTYVIDPHSGTCAGKSVKQPVAQQQQKLLRKMMLM